MGSVQLHFASVVNSDKQDCAGPPAQRVLFTVGYQGREVAQEVQRRGLLSKEIWVEALAGYAGVAEVLACVCQGEKPAS